MKVIAISAWGEGIRESLTVKSNPLGALHIQPSITVRMQNGRYMRYATITDFLCAWGVISVDTHTIAIPFLKNPIGAGDCFALVAERMPLWFKRMFNGCNDRRQWWNWLVRFVPMKERKHLKSHLVHANRNDFTFTAMTDDVQDIRRALRLRGENPENYRKPPCCDICRKEPASHVTITEHGHQYILCDQPHCQYTVYNTAEIFTVLESRGDTVLRYKSLPFCDICGSRNATVVQKGSDGKKYILCDMPTCQEYVKGESQLQEENLL